jgi:biotin-[acetyl-CoA-carboxylase] ligase BirA-like protein
MTKTPNKFAATVKGRLRGITGIMYLDDSPSTQDVARALACTGAHQGTLVIAGTQSGGRGRLGRVWESSEGGLYMSVVLHPVAAPADLGELSIAVAGAVSQTLSELYGIKCRVKEPNDVLAWQPDKKKFLKISGILTESATGGALADWVVVGIGVNLSNNLSRETGAIATTIKRITGKAPSRDEFLQKFFGIFWDTYSAWEYKAASRRS